MDPPALTCQAVGPTRGPRSKKPKTIGSLGHALDFVTIGKLGNALKFVTIGKIGNATRLVTIGKIGNVRPIAKIANGRRERTGRERAWGAMGAKSPKSLVKLARLSR